MIDFLPEWMKNLMPLWAWFVFLWVLTTFVVKPYINAVVKLYQPKIDLAAEKTPFILKRVWIEIRRFNSIVFQLPFLIAFVLTPKSRRLIYWRKNEVVYYVWLFSKEFPSMEHYRETRAWFEKYVYKDNRTSYFFPEELKTLEKPKKAVTKKLVLDHRTFVAGLKANTIRPVVLVGHALIAKNAGDWFKKGAHVFHTIQFWLYALSLVAGVVFLFLQNILALALIGCAILLFRIDRRMLRRRILKYAIQNETFYQESIDNGIILLGNYEFSIGVA